MRIVLSKRLFYLVLLGIGPLTAQMLTVSPAIATDIVITASPASAPDDSAAAGQEQPSSRPEDARDRVYYPGDTERAGPLLRKMAGNLLLDQKEIWTSPFHMRRGDA